MLKLALNQTPVGVRRRLDRQCAAMCAIDGAALVEDLEIATYRDLRCAELARETIHDDASIAIDSVYDAPATFLVQHDLENPRWIKKFFSVRFGFIMLESSENAHGNLFRLPALLMDPDEESVQGEMNVG